MGLFGKLIYSTEEYKGHGKKNYNSYEYYRDGDTVTRIRHNRRKHFDGHDNEWVETDHVTDKWKVDDPSLPDWLKKHL